MPLRGRKRKGYVRKEESAEEVEDGEEERQEEGERLRAGNEIGAKAKDDAIFAAGRFHDLGLAPALSDHIHAKLSFSAPTLIQKSAIPLILSGRDVLVNADTGTGKTMVYLAPIINALQSYEPRVTRSDGTLALVLVPTRELCLQVCAVAEQVVHRFHWLVPGCVMGGENRSKEKARLRKGITILVATPGRLLDHLKNTASFRHDRLRWLVFDEADRLLDLGFEKDIESILEVLGSRDDNNRKRQHVLLSATLNERVEQLAALSLVKPATVGLEEAKQVEMASSRKVGNGSAGTQVEFHKNERNMGDAGPSDGYTEYRIPSQLVQSFLKVPCSLRLVALLGLLQQKSQGNSSCKLVVFFSTCDAVDFHYTVVNEFRWSPTPWKDGGGKDERMLLGCEAFRLHGSMAQKDRTEAYNQFGKASSAILLCTDVAARGLDFQNVSGIVQYEPPGDAAEYVHRVGRTARLGQKGEAILFLQPSEAEYMEELKKHGVSLQELSLPQLLDGLQDRRGKRDDSFLAVEMHPLAGLMQKALEAFVAAKPDARLLAVDSFRSYVRAYAAHRGELKSIFQVRKLHLGHVAKSFGLRDAPSLFGKSVNKQSLKKEKERNVKKRQRKKMRPTPGATAD
ncbi:hypothetical protein M758_2G188600 [Ceratodon purpureus]|nr:hypothetical protein M758_2G188600 [Ceratodon purpureus]